MLEYKNWDRAKHLFTIIYFTNLFYKYYFYYKRSLYYDRISINGFQDFSSPFTQRKATSESYQQLTKLMEKRSVKATNTSFKALLSKEKL